MTCRLCGSGDEETRGGVCFACATIAELRMAKRTTVEHLWSAVRHILTRRWTYASIDLAMARGRLAQSGDYAPGGYFDREHPGWRDA